MSLIESLSLKRDLILPYFENAICSNKWPSSYQITVDSSPYYGLNEDGSPDGYFHPSTHPLLPARLLYHMFHPSTRDRLIVERPSLQREMTFSMGSALHAVLQTQLTMAKILVPEDIEVEYINHEHHVRGRIDAMVNHPTEGRILVEIKTRSGFLYGRQTGPEPSWVAQVNLGLDSQDCDLGVLLMMESGFPYRMSEFHIQRDHVILDAIYAKFDMVRKAVADSVPPPADCVSIKDCPARDVCGCGGASCRT